MDNSNDLIKQATSEIAASKIRLPTEAGQAKKDVIAKQDAINQIFTLFRINYHNQYFAAYGQGNSLESENYARKLWFDSLKHFPPEQLLLAAKQIIEQSEYLPSLHKMIEACEDNLQSIGLPSPPEAYIEACNAPSPKITYQWTHPAVYFAGLKTGWQRLSNETEKQSYPSFAKRYREQIRLVIAGEKLQINTPKQIIQDPGKALSREEKQQKLNELKKLL